MSMTHTPVLLNEAVQALSIQSDGIYLDATFGCGGHSRQILSQLGDAGRLYALDRDIRAAKVAEGIHDARFFFARRPFSEMADAFSAVGSETLSGVLFDLGVSSPQLDEAARGFSFLREGPLDMRMDTTTGLSAHDWLMQIDEKTLAATIRDLGGEAHSIAKRIAAAIIAARNKIKTTTALAEVITQAMPKKHFRPGQHPATQTFQAIRMAVNDEVGEIRAGLAIATRLLKSGGMLVVITFHGLEDALVKRFIRNQEGVRLPAELPLQDKGWRNQVLRLVMPVVRPSIEEVTANPRCRSARLRKAVKL